MFSRNIFPYGSLSHPQSTPAQSHQSEGCEMHEDIINDGGEGSSRDENTTEMPNPHEHAIWEDSLQASPRLIK